LTKANSRCIWLRIPALALPAEFLWEKRREHEFKELKDKVVEIEAAERLRADCRRPA
jgi:hypothetical protein